MGEVVRAGTTGPISPAGSAIHRANPVPRSGIRDDAEGERAVRASAPQGRRYTHTRAGGRLSHTLFERLAV
jgi:hypothetical protein